MRNLYLITFLALAFHGFGQYAVVNDCTPGINGLYYQASTDATGRYSYQANRNCTYCSPQTIYFDVAGGRWVIAGSAYGTPFSFAFNYNASSPKPPETGWIRAANGCNLTSTTTIYFPQTIESKQCSACLWSSPDTWINGIVPTDNNPVTINGNILLDADVITPTIAIKPEASLTSVSNQSLTINGLLNNSGLLNVYSLTLGSLGGAGENVLPQNQSLDGSRVRIQKLIVANQGVLSLSSDLSVLVPGGSAQRNVTLQGGKIELGNYNLTCHGVQGVHVTTNGRGRLIYQLPAGRIRADFPIASVDDAGINRFTPVLISGVVNSASAKPVQLSAGVGPFNPSHTLPGSTRYAPIEWTLSSDHETLEESFFIDFGGPDIGFLPPDFNLNSFYVKRWNGTAWESKAGPKPAERYIGQGGGGIGMSVDNITQFSSWTLFDGEATLPVKLVNFKGTWDGSSALLSWTTADEQNSQKFEVQHSLSGKAWQKIGEIPAKGNSSELQRYTFRHPELSAGNHYYRLKMIDNDGSSSFSRIVSLASGTESTISFYPNPATDRLYFSTENGISKVFISDLSGKVLFEYNEIKDGIPVKHLPSNPYFCTIIYTDGRVRSGKIIVSK